MVFPGALAGNAAGRLWRLDEEHGNLITIRRARVGDVHTDVEDGLSARCGAGQVEIRIFEVGVAETVPKGEDQVHAHAFNILSSVKLAVAKEIAHRCLEFEGELVNVLDDELPLTALRARALLEPTQNLRRHVIAPLRSGQLTFGLLVLQSREQLATGGVEVTNRLRPLLDLLSSTATRLGNEAHRLHAFERLKETTRAAEVEQRAVILAGSTRRLELLLDSVQRTTVAPNGAVLTDDELRALERSNLVAALEKAQWRVGGKGGAAQLLGLQPSTLRDRMRSFGIERER